MLHQPKYVDNRQGPMYGARLGQVNRRLCQFADAAFAWIAEMDEHQMDTTRMHSDRALGAIHESRRVRTMANLYVADSSVLPTAAADNAGATIVAPALRLADHLTRQLA
jgi:choline dehydrogenase-like flavoprotein